MPPLPQSFVELRCVTITAKLVCRASMLAPNSSSSPCPTEMPQTESSHPCPRRAHTRSQHERANTVPRASGTSTTTVPQCPRAATTTTSAHHSGLPGCGYRFPCTRWRLLHIPSRATKRPSARHAAPDTRPQDHAPGAPAPALQAGRRHHSCLGCARRPFHALPAAAGSGVPCPGRYPGHRETRWLFTSQLSCHIHSARARPVGVHIPPR